MYCRCARRRNGSGSRFYTTSNGSSICAHVSDVTKTNVQLTQSVQDLLAAHPVNNPILYHTDACDILIVTVNSAEALARSHIVGQPE